MSGYCESYIFRRIPLRLIPDSHTKNSRTVVIIPAAEEEQLLLPLQSLLDNRDFEGPVDCIVLINEPENATQDVRNLNLAAYKKACTFSEEYSDRSIRFHIVYVRKIPVKLAGVGLARKIAMDEACSILEDRSGGMELPICSLDADCEVSPNYLCTIQGLFTRQNRMDLLNMYFEHRWSSPQEREAILQYELHLRYYIQMQRKVGLPFAYHTVGSSFAVRKGAYRRMGGMNTRKAGEDFYFIHKFTKRNSVAETSKAIVFPAARPSLRTPFGTGRAVSQIMSGGGVFLTYHPECFKILKQFIARIPDFWRWPDVQTTIDGLSPVLKNYLDSKNFAQVLTRLKSNSTNPLTFSKALFQWFDAFRLVKFLHYARDHGYPTIEVSEAIQLSGLCEGLPENSSASALLGCLRQKDRNSSYNGLNVMQALWEGR